MATTPEKRLALWRPYIGARGWMGEAAKIIVPQLEAIIARQGKND